MTTRNRTIGRPRGHALIGLAASVLALGLVTTAPARADGDLATKAEELETLVLGTDTIGYAVSVKEYNLTTGQSYTLEIESSGFHEYELVAPEFFQNIWIRRLEADDVEIKLPTLYSLSFEGEAEAEIYFVPIRPGTYEMYAEGLKEKGTVVTINVK